MPKTARNQKSRDSQLIEDIPQVEWGHDRLGEYAQKQHEAIRQHEGSLTVRYWRLGMSLNLLRGAFSRGEWGKFLREHGIDKTYASKARAIHRTFKTEKSLKGVSVQEAYRQREIRPRAATVPKRHTRGKPNGMADWFVQVCEMADSFLDEANKASPDEAETLVSAADKALQKLSALRSCLERRADTA